MPRLAGLGELPLESLALVLGVGVVALDVRAGSRSEWQEEAVQVAAVAHQLRVVRRPVAPCLVVTRPQPAFFKQLQADARVCSELPARAVAPLVQLLAGPSEAAVPNPAS